MQSGFALFGVRRGQGLGEGGGRSEADHAVRLLALLVEQDDAGRAEQAEALEQRLVLGVIGGDIGLDQHIALHLAADRRVRKVSASISLQDTHQSA